MLEGLEGLEGHDVEHRSRVFGARLAEFALCALLSCSRREVSQAEPVPVTAIRPASPSSSEMTPAKASSGAWKIRESTTVMVDGVLETWLLEWREPPELSCVDPQWSSCPCYGFAFAEQGKMDLVRDRDGIIERFDLGSVFASVFGTVFTHYGEDKGTAIVQGWAPTKEENENAALSDTGPSVADLAARPRVKVMTFGDYDHDGAATEFVLQIGTQPCFRQHSVVVGVSRTNRHLHVFRDENSPALPIILPYKKDWEQVRTKVPRRLQNTACDDHGSETERDAFVTADARGLHVKTQTKPCP